MGTNKNQISKELKKNRVNFWALTPISFLMRTANIWPEKIAWIHGGKQNTYKQLLSRCLKIADSLRKKGLKKGDTVSVILPNVPAMIECHFVLLSICRSMIISMTHSCGSHGTVRD